METFVPLSVKFSMTIVNENFAKLGGVFLGIISLSSLMAN